MPSYSRPISIYVKGVKDESSQLGAIGISYEDPDYGRGRREMVPGYLCPITESTATYWAILRALQCHPHTPRGTPGLVFDIACDNQLCIATLLLYKAAQENEVEDFDDFCPNDEGLMKQIMRQLQSRKKDTVHFTFLRHAKRGGHEDALAIATVELQDAMKQEAITSPSPIERDLEVLSITTVDEE